MSTVSRGRGVLVTLGKDCSATKTGIFGRTEQFSPAGLTWRSGATWWQEPTSLVTHVPVLGAGPIHVNHLQYDTSGLEDGSAAKIRYCCHSGLQFGFQQSPLGASPSPVTPAVRNLAPLASSDTCTHMHISTQRHTCMQ